MTTQTQPADVYAKTVGQFMGVLASAPLYSTREELLDALLKVAEGHVQRRDADILQRQQEAADALANLLTLHEPKPAALMAA